MSYLLHLANLICVYLVLASSLNVVLGYCGLLSLCHAALYGLGAYTAAVASTRLGLDFAVTLPLAAAVGLAAAWMIARLSARFKGDYFVLGTLAIQFVIIGVINNWVSVTRGPFGISGIPSPRIFGIEFSGPEKFLFISAPLCAACLWVLRRITASPFGRMLKAVREDPVAAEALGKDVPLARRRAFAIGGAFAGLAGAMYAHYVGYIDPTSFLLQESVFMVSILIAGGMGNMTGPVAGTLLLVLLPEALRFLYLPDALAANIRQVALGLVLILAVVFRPRGLAGDYALEEA